MTSQGSSWAGVLNLVSVLLWGKWGDHPPAQLSEVRSGTVEGRGRPGRKAGTRPFETLKPKEIAASQHRWMGGNERLWKSPGI